MGKIFDVFFSRCCFNRLNVWAKRLFWTISPSGAVVSSLWPGSSSSSPPSSIFQQPCGTLEFPSFHHLWRLSLQTPTAVLVHVDVCFTQQRPGGFTHNGRACARGLVGFWHAALTLSLSRCTDAGTDGKCRCIVYRGNVHTLTSCVMRNKHATQLSLMNRSDNHTILIGSVWHVTILRFHHVVMWLATL